MSEKHESKSETKKPGNIYDAFVKMIFGRIVVFADFLLHYADPKFVRNIEINKIYPAPTHTIGLKGDERISDLIFSCPLKNRNGTQKAVIVFEHAGSSLKNLPIKLHGYASGIWLAELKAGAKVLSALYFIVLRTGKKPYRRRLTTVADWLPKDENGEPIGMVLEVKYDVVDLPSFDLNKLCGSPELRLAMGILKKMAADTEEAEFANWHEALLPLLEIADEEKQVELIKELLEFVAKVFTAHNKRLEAEAINQALKPIFRERTKTMIPTIFEEKYLEGVADGEARGKAIGEARGEAIGEARGEAKSIIRTLTHRIKTPSKKLQNKIYSIQDVAKLNELADFAWTCVSLEEFDTALN